MTFEAAVSAHSEWKVKLILFLNDSGRLEEEVVQDDRQCTLGCWLYGEGQRYQRYPEFQAFKEDHGEFHRQAADIVRLIKEGKKEDAKDLIAPNGAFSRLAMQIEERTFRLRYRLRHQAA